MIKEFLITCLLSLIIYSSCNKKFDTNLNQTNLINSKLISSLKDSISIGDYKKLDLNRCISYTLNVNQTIYQIGTVDSSKFIIFVTDRSEKIITGKFIKFTKNLDTINSKNIYNGSVIIQSLNGNEIVNSDIKNNFIINTHVYSRITSNDLNSKIKSFSVCNNCTLPDVIVTSTPNNSTYTVYFNLLNLVDIGLNNQFIPVNPEYGYGGGNNLALADITTINVDIPENKIPVNPKSMVDCFGTISNIGAKYSISIASNIPVDGRPEQVINGFNGGHVFLTLTKSNSLGQNISQVIGFYPVNSILSGTTINVPSMIVNDENHKFNAIFTLNNISSTNFQSAMNTVLDLSNNNYNLLDFNCTDFALGVFNSAGGNLKINPFTMPVFNNNIFIGNFKIANTPSSLYYKISSLQNSNNNNAQIGISNAGSSHGPC